MIRTREQRAWFHQRYPYGTETAFIPIDPLGKVLHRIELWLAALQALFMTPRWRARYVTVAQGTRSLRFSIRRTRRRSAT